MTMLLEGAKINGGGGVSRVTEAICCVLLVLQRISNLIVPTFSTRGEGAAVASVQG